MHLADKTADDVERGLRPLHDRHWILIDRPHVDSPEKLNDVVRSSAAAVSREAHDGVSGAALKALRARFGGGSIASTCVWLAGRAGRDALARLLVDEIEPIKQLSVHEVVAAVKPAHDIDSIQKASQSH